MNDNEQQQPVIDTHHHFFDLEAVYYPWLTDRPEPHFLLGDYDAIKRNFSPADYRREAEGCNIVKTVHVEAEADHDDPLRETRWLTGVAAQSGLPTAIVAHATFHHPDVEAVLKAQAACPLVRGIRSKPSTSVTAQDSVKGQPGAMDDPTWRAGLKRLAAHGLSWDLRVAYWHLAEAAEVVGEIPDTTVILEHCGLPWDRGEAGLAVWRDGMTRLAARENVWLKISELGLPDGPWSYEDNRRVVLEAIEIFGIERCMFGSNAPVSGLRIGFREQLAALKRMTEGLSASESHLLFYENAAQAYRL